MTSPMTPVHARGLLIALDRNPGSVVSTPTAKRALEAIAGMRVEEDWRIVPTDSNGGAYETRRHTRHVTEWEVE